jgi:hypothetical protein
MGQRRGAAVALTVVALTATSPVLARPGPCEAVRVIGDRAALPAPWRDVIDALVQATATPGLPWSCPGGTVQLALESTGAVLTVTDTRGSSASRRVPSPAELVPTGEALLAAPADDRAPPVVVPPPEPPRPEATRVALAPPAPREPRLLVQVLLGARTSGPGLTGWGTGQIRGVLPLEAWSIGFWARYDLPLAGPPSAPDGFQMNGVSAGFAVGRRLVDGPFEVRVSLDPSMAIVMMESGAEEDPDHPEGAKIAFRLGTLLSGSFRFNSTFRGVIALDGEFAPAGISGLRKIQSTLPAVPVYSAGLMFGVEAMIR